MGAREERRSDGSQVFMKPNLDALKLEIEEYLATSEFAVFHGYSRMLDSLPLVHWDVDRYPQYQKFLEVARRADTKIVVYHQREFTPDHIDDALERLKEAEMPRDEKRGFERRLREMRVYEGFLCALELSFDHHGRVYLFDLQTEWYEELGDILDEIDFATPDEAEDDSSLGGYYSNN